MLKRCLAVLLLLVCVLSFSACGEDPLPYEEHYGYKMISNYEVVEYYFYVPEDWIVDEQTGMTSAHLSAQDRTNVSVTTYERSSLQVDTLEAFWQKYEADFASVYGAGLSYTKNESGAENKAISRTLGGQPALGYEYKKEFLGQTYCVNQVVTLYQNRFYLFTFMGLAGEGEESFAKNVDTGAITDMLAHFQFK